MVILREFVLYTDQTSVLAFPVLNGLKSTLELLTIWSFVIVGNLLGEILLVFYVVDLASQLNLFDKETSVKIADHILENSYWVLLLSSIITGWLMGLLTR